MPKLLSINKKWILPLTDEEVISIFALLHHCERNDIKSTKEEKLAVLKWLEEQALKEQILESEIEKVNQYE